MNTCGSCGQNITHGKRRGAKYCSQACRQRAYRARSTAIPKQMRSAPRWVTWKPIRRGPGWSKMPIQLNGNAASSTNESTWTSWNRVKDLSRKGFVLGNGIGCIDLDGCLLKTGEPMSWAREVINHYADRAILVEVSPSGRGVHIFLPMDPGKGRVIRDGRNIEIYPPDSGRFICVTGKALEHK